MNKTVFFYVVLGAVIGASFVVIVLSTVNKSRVFDQKPSRPRVTKEVGENANVAVTGPNSWQVGKSYDVDVSFVQPPVPFPTAVTLELYYNPTLVRLSEIRDGDLWTNMFVLKSNIDNEEGKAVVTLGQEFSAGVSGGLLIAEFEFVPVGKSGAGVISVGPKSVMAKVDKYRLIDPSSLNININ